MLNGKLPMFITIIAFLPSISSIKPINTSTYFDSLNACLYELTETYFKDQFGILIQFSDSQYEYQASDFMKKIADKLTWNILIKNNTFYNNEVYNSINSHLIFWSQNMFPEVKHNYTSDQLYIIVTKKSENPKEIVNSISTHMQKNGPLKGLILIPTSETKVYLYAIIQDLGKTCLSNNITKMIDYCSNGKYFNNMSRINKTFLPKSCYLRVSYPVRPPFVIMMDNYTTQSDKNGLDITLMNLFARIMNIKLVYVRSAVLGDINEKGVARGSLLKLQNNEVDICIGGYADAHLLHLYFEPTGPYLFDHMLWCVPKVYMRNIGRWYKASDSASLILYCLYFVLSCTSVWYFSKKSTINCTYSYMPNAIFHTIRSMFQIAGKAPKTKARWIFIQTVIFFWIFL